MYYQTYSMKYKYMARMRGADRPATYSIVKAYKTSNASGELMVFARFVDDNLDIIPSDKDNNWACPASQWEELTPEKLTEVREYNKVPKRHKELIDWHINVYGTCWPQKTKFILGVLQKAAPTRLVDEAAARLLWFFQNDIL